MKWRYQFGYKAREATSKLVATVSKAPNYTSPEWPFKASNHSFRPHPTPLDHLPTLPWQVFWIWTSEPNFEPLPIWIVPIWAPSTNRTGRTGRKLPGQVQGRRATSPIRKALAPGSTCRSPVEPNDLKNSRKRWLQTRYGLKVVALM